MLKINTCEKTLEVVSESRWGCAVALHLSPRLEQPYSVRLLSGFSLDMQHQESRLDVISIFENKFLFVFILFLAEQEMESGCWVC